MCRTVIFYFLGFCVECDTVSVAETGPKVPMCLVNTTVDYNFPGSIEGYYGVDSYLPAPYPQCLRGGDFTELAIVYKFLIDELPYPSYNLGEFCIRCISELAWRRFFDHFVCMRHEDSGFPMHPVLMNYLSNAAFELDADRWWKRTLRWTNHLELTAVYNAISVDYTLSTHPSVAIRALQSMERDRNFPHHETQNGDGPGPNLSPPDWFYRTEDDVPPEVLDMYPDGRVHISRELTGELGARPGPHFTFPCWLVPWYKLLNWDGQPESPDH